MLQILVATLARWTLRASYSLEGSEPNIVKYHRLTATMRTWTVAVLQECLGRLQKPSCAQWDQELLSYEQFYISRRWGGSHEHS